MCGLFDGKKNEEKEKRNDTLFTGTTMNGPPAPLLMNAMNFGLTSQKRESQVISVTWKWKNDVGLRPTVLLFWEK